MNNTIIPPRSEIRGPRSAIRDPQSTIRNLLARRIPAPFARAALLAMTLATATPAMAATWTGGNGDINTADWSNTSKWSGGSAPSPGNSIYNAINFNGSTVTLASAPPYSADLQPSGNDNVNVATGTQSLSALRPQSAATQYNQTGGTVTVNNGDSNLDGMRYGAGTINLTGGTLNSWHGMGVEGTAALNVGGGAGPALLTLKYNRMQYSPTMNIGLSGSGAGAVVTLKDNGTITVMNTGTTGWHGITIGPTSGARGTFNLQGGTLDMGSRNIILDSVATTSVFNFTGGRLANLDSFIMLNQAMTDSTDPLSKTRTVATLTQSGGTLAPGTVTYPSGVRTVSLVGTTTINGDYTQSGTATLEIDMASLSSFDKVVVSQVGGSAGNATLTGVNVKFVDAYTPTIGDTFDVLTAAGTTLDISGLVVTGSGAWTASVVPGTPNILRLTAVAPPESKVALSLSSSTMKEDGTDSPVTVTATVTPASPQVVTVILTVPDLDGK